MSSALIPCPLAASGALTFNTAELPDGLHQIRLVIEDIAGNTTSSRTVRVFTANHPTPNGTNPSRQAKLTAAFTGGKRNVTLPYGHTSKITGRLTDTAGHGIAGASIRVLATIARTGEHQKLFATPKTDSTGHFAYTPKVGPSRTFRLAYRAYDTDPTDAATKTLIQRVRAGIRLTIAPRTLRNGHSMRIRGALLGGPGRKGALVTMQVLNPRRISFLTLRADARGVFKGSYRFHNTHQRYTFKFRAVVLRQAAYPYAGATSATRRVTVLP